MVGIKAMEKHMPRSTINKVLVLTGSLMCLTGIFLLFHYESHFALAVHQIAGLIFVVFCILHIKINWNAIAKLFKSSFTPYIIISILIISTIIMFVTGDIKNR